MANQEQLAQSDFAAHLHIYMPQLQARISLLKEDDQKFVTSLCYHYHSKGDLSSKQIPYAYKYWLLVWEQEATKGSYTKADGSEYKAPVKRVVAEPEATAPRVTIDPAATLQLLDNAAKAGLQWPKIIYKFPVPAYGLTGIHFYITGGKSAHPNSLGIVGHLEVPINNSETMTLCICQRKGHNVWYQYTFNKPELQQLCKIIAEDPIIQFSANGRATGTCCFCSRGLTDSRSITVGYGPICASKYGLPWGHAPEPAKLDIGL